MPRQNTEAIAAEITALEAMKPRVRRWSHFGDDNHAAIDAQLRVLREHMDAEDVLDAFETAEEATIDCALQASEWLFGCTGAEPVSRDWLNLVVS